MIWALALTCIRYMQRLFIAIETKALLDNKLSRVAQGISTFNTSAGDENFIEGRTIDYANLYYDALSQCTQQFGGHEDSHSGQCRSH